MGKIRGTGSRGEEDSHLPAKDLGKKRMGGEKETSKDIHKKMGYWIRSEETPLLVKEDLTAKSKSCFPYSPLAKIEEWWEDD